MSFDAGLREVLWAIDYHGNTDNNRKHSINNIDLFLIATHVSFHWHFLWNGSIRFATLLYYLNEVEEGGETAFIVADNETYSFEVSRLHTK